MLSPYKQSLQKATLSQFVQLTCRKLYFFIWTINKVKSIGVQQVALLVDQICSLICFYWRLIRYPYVLLVCELQGLSEATLSWDGDASREDETTIFIQAIFYCQYTVLHLIQPSFLVLGG